MVQPSMEKAFIVPWIPIPGGPMDRTLDEFIKGTGKRAKSGEPPRKKRKRLKPTSLESFLPEEQVNYFKQLRIGSKRIRNARIEEL